MRTIALLTLATFSTLAQASDCQPTASRTVGTHYDISKATHQSGDIGEGLLMSGQVLSAKDCKPLANVRVLHWQAGESGRYEDHLYAWRYTDAEGRFSFETEWPNLNPPHVHFLVEAPQHRTLATQWISRETVTEGYIELVVESQ